jgi:fumarylacetoacetate (FAA) hydrolase
MKLASLKGGADGRLIVVSRDLTRAADATAVAPTLLAALDDWQSCAPPLRELAERLEAGRVASTAFDPRGCAAPLPRAFGWADGSAYLSHAELLRKSRGSELPASAWTDPLIYRGGSDRFLGARDPIPLGDEEWGADLEAEVAVIIGDVRQGAARDEAARAIRLLALVNDVSFRNLIPAELAKGFGFFQGKGMTAFSPVAVTPDELGSAWDGAKVSLPLHSAVNGAPFGRPNAGVDCVFDFPALIAHAVKTRPFAGPSIVGSGTVSNRGSGGGPAEPIAAGGTGYSCIAELRAVETLRHGAPRAPYLEYGDRVRIEMLDAAGSSIFGAIDQEIAQP